MKTKQLLSMLAMLFCVVAFSACSDDDESGSGITGTYATPSQFDPLVKHEFRMFIVVSKNMVTYYHSMAVNSSSYWGNGSKQVPGASGWYVEPKSERSAAYVEYEGKLVLETGDIYVIQGDDLVKSGERYSKYK